MPKPDWEDLSVFFNPSEFADKALILRGGQKVAEVLGIFDDPNQVASLGEFDLENPVPRFTCAAEDVAVVNTGDVVSIDGALFDLMQDPELDGTGVAVLVLATPNVVYNAGI